MFVCVAVAVLNNTFPVFVDSSKQQPFKLFVFCKYLSAVCVTHNT